MVGEEKLARGTVNCYNTVYSRIMCHGFKRIVYTMLLMLQGKWCKLLENNTSLTPQEVADILKIAKNTVYVLIKRGELNGYRVGKKVRVDYKDVVAYKNKTKSIKDAVPEPAESHWANDFNTPLDAEEHVLERGFVICGQDIVLDILARMLEMHPAGVRPLRSYYGSYNGLYLLYKGEVQVASTHIWDSATNSYNVPFVRTMLPGTPALLVRIGKRMEGFYVAKGNPKGIKNWEDLRRLDITVVNRERGSGARILLDEHLRQLGVQGQSLPGYGRECHSHLAVASTISRGGGDFGIGNEKAAMQVKNIDFIPLQEESYDIVMRKEDLDKPPFKAILEIVASSTFRAELEGIGGYDLTDLGKVVYID